MDGAARAERPQVAWPPPTGSAQPEGGEGDKTDTVEMSGRAAESVHSSNLRELRGAIYFKRNIYVLRNMKPKTQGSQQQKRETNKENTG